MPGLEAREVEANNCNSHQVDGTYNVVSSNDKHKREIKSFVCRNRKLSNNHQKLLDNCYPLWGLPNDQDWDFAQIFPNDKNLNVENQQIIIEIGFGTGDTLIRNAIDNPEINYIGIEMYQSGCLNVLNFQKENHLTNLRVCFGDAKEILAKYVKKHSLSGIQIFFPDPWPKKKHHKRRLVQTEFVDMLADKLSPGGFVHMATDWVNYAEHMAVVMDSNSNYYLDNKNRSRLLTKFEQKGMEKGHEVRDLVYRVHK